MQPVHSVHFHAGLIFGARVRVLRRHRHLHFGKSGGKPPHSKRWVSGLGVRGYSSKRGETQDE